MSDAALMTLVRTIVTADDTIAFHLLAANPALAKGRFEIGATRQTAETFYLDEIGHYIYAGDTALHLAAAAYRQVDCAQADTYGGQCSREEPPWCRTPSLRRRWHAGLAHMEPTRKQRPSPVLSQQAPIQTPQIKA